MENTASEYPIYHWYHVYADGNWHTPMWEHTRALLSFGLYERLKTIFVGFVGSPLNIERARQRLMDWGVNFEVCATSDTGFEQVTQHHLYEFSTKHDGLCVYAHTKGASHQPTQSVGIGDTWRRHMTWHTICQWQEPLLALESGKRVSGCHWIPTPQTGNEHQHLHNPPSVGFFGGTFWWTHLHELRNIGPPSDESRYCAEHWLGQAVPSLVPSDIQVLGTPDSPIGTYAPHTIDWVHTFNVV